MQQRVIKVWNYELKKKSNYYNHEAQVTLDINFSLPKKNPTTNQKHNANTFLEQKQEESEER